MSLENHHNIPVSLWGPDCDSNKLYLDTKKHQQIHNAQNIPHGALRKVRMELNDVIVRTPKKIKMVHNMQRLYFHGVKNLPNELIIPQTNSLTKMIRYREYQVKSALGQFSEEKYSVDEGWKEPPVINGTHKETIDECKQKLETLFRIDEDRVRAVIRYYQSLNK